MKKHLRMLLVLAIAIVLIVDVYLYCLNQSRIHSPSEGCEANISFLK